MPPTLHAGYFLFISKFGFSRPFYIQICVYIRVRAKEVSGGSSTTAFLHAKSCRKVARQTAGTSTGVWITSGRDRQTAPAKDSNHQRRPPIKIILPSSSASPAIISVGDCRVEGRAGTANSWNWTAPTIRSTADRRLLMLLRLCPASQSLRGVSALLLHYWAGPRWPGVHWAATETAVQNALDTFRFIKYSNFLSLTHTHTHKIQIGSDFVRW